MGQIGGLTGVYRVSAGKNGIGLLKVPLRREYQFNSGVEQFGHPSSWPCQIHDDALDQDGVDFCLKWAPFSFQ